MRISISLATVSLTVLALAACGGPPESADEQVTEEIAVEDGAVDEVELTEAETGAEDATEAGEADAEDDAPEATATPTPTPSAAASAAPRATATPTQAAAATAPSSFTICTVCHSVTPGQNMVGPSLAGVVGRKAGSVAGFSYSPAMKSSNLTWTEANLRRYIVDPHAVVPGGSMPAPGVNAQQAGEIVTYMKSL